MPTQLPPETRIRTLVADDSANFVEIICALAEMDDLEIVGRAKNGPEAIAAVADLRPELLLMDVHLPGMSGLITAMLISEHFPQTKVILMAGEDSRPLRAECYACGALGFVHKPELIQKLGAALAERFVASHRQHATAYLQPGPGEG